MTGVATSQSTIDNSQTQSAPVTDSQTLNVVDVSGATTGVTAATGNSLSGAVTNGSLAVTSSQTLNADVATSTTLNVTTNAGSPVTLNTASTGNTTDIAGVSGGGPVTGTLAQTAGAVNVTASSQINASGAQAGAGSTGTQAITNSMGFANQDTALTATTHQTSAAAADSEDGAVLTYTPGTAAFSSSAVSNNLTGSGTGQASQSISATQTMTGARTQAGEFSYFGNAQTAQAASTASDNNISISNQSGGLTVVDNQTNTSFTRAQTDLGSYAFGSAQASAYGVGNSVLAANIGASTSLDNTQTNSGEVDALSSFSGNNGFDASSSATAMGNAATGFACSDCGGVINISNSQSNSNTVSATSNLTIAASNRSVSSVATAVGNSATFYVSKPSQ